jgi:hypothetical protein
MSIQSIAYHLRATCGGKSRALGTVFVAGSDAPLCIKGQLIFYRNTLEKDKDLFMHTTQTTGASKAAYEQCVRDGVKWIVAQSKRTNRMIVVGIEHFTIERNFGQGLQVHAPLTSTIFDAPHRRLYYPTAIETVVVEDEDVVQNVLPLIVPAPPIKQKGTYRKCGCYFVDGRIDKPCTSHKEMWKGALSA